TLLYPLGQLVVPALSVDAAMGGLASPSARVALQTATAATHVYLGTTFGNVRWDVGPGARIGWMHLAGKPDPGARLEGLALSAPWGGPELGARVAYGPRRSPLFALELAAGFVTLPIGGLRDQTERIYEVKGPWASLSAEVGVGL